MAPLVPPINSWCLVFYECGFSSCFRDALQSLSHAFVQSLPASQGHYQYMTLASPMRARVPSCKEVLG